MNTPSIKFLKRAVGGLSALALVAVAEAGCDGVDCDNPLNIVREVHGQAEGQIPCIAGVYAEGLNTTAFVTATNVSYEPQETLAMCITKNEAAEVLQCDTVPATMSACGIVREALDKELNPTGNPDQFILFPEECLSGGGFVCVFGANYGKVSKYTAFDAADVENLEPDTAAYFCDKHKNNVTAAAAEIWPTP